MTGDNLQTRLLFGRLAKVFPKSLLNEFYILFGPENTEKLLKVYAGCTLRIPSTKEIERVERDLEIYEQLALAKNSDEFKNHRKLIQGKHNLSKRKVRSIFRAMEKLHREAEKVKATDRSVTYHRQVKIKGKKRKGWLG